MGPEKRLPLALFLCFIVLMVVQFRNAPEQPTPEDTNASETQTSVEGATPAEAGASPDTAIAAVAPGAEAPESDLPVVPEWSEWIEYGNPGEKGHLSVLYHSWGGGIAEIRYANQFLTLGLSDEEKLERENQIPIVVPTVERLNQPPGTRTLHTLMLSAGLKAQGAFVQDLQRVHWQHKVVDGSVIFTHEDPSGLVLEKRIDQVAGEDRFEVQISARTTNEAFAGHRYEFSLVASVGMPSVGEDSFYMEPKAVAAVVGEDLQDEGPDLDGTPRREGLTQGNMSFLGTHNKYFAMLLRPVSESAKTDTLDASLERIFDMEWATGKSPALQIEEGFRDLLVDARIRLEFPSVGAPANTYTYSLYAGPKDPTAFTKAEESFNKIIDEDLGFFDGIAKLILGFLRFLHGIVGNWGWAIILLTLTVRLMLFPLNRRMQTSMARHASKMKRVQPKIDAVKKKYADKPQELRQEQAKIFQEEGVMPPLGGCLPMFLQIPIFFGLFSALRVAVDLRHQPFMGWIDDLSKPDHLARIDLNTHLPFIQTIEWFNLLPILMVVLWIAQQRVMPKPQAQDEQAKQMQKIMMWMPIMFGFFLYNYAAGLSLYMITTSAFGILESTVIRKIWPIDDSEQPKKKKGKFMQRLEELQKQATAQQEAQARAKKGNGKGKR